MDGLPRLFRDRLDVLLEDGLRGVLAHLEAGKAPEGIGVLQVKGKLLIGQLTVLLEDGASQHLLGGHSLPAGVGTSVAVRSLNTRSITDGVASRMSEIPLSSFTIELLMIGEKRFIWGLNLCRILEPSLSVISNDTKELRTYSTMRSRKTTVNYRLFARYFKDLGFPDGN